MRAKQPKANRSVEMTSSNLKISFHVSVGTFQSPAVATRLKANLNRFHVTSVRAAQHLDRLQPGSNSFSPLSSQVIPDQKTRVNSSIFYLS